MMHDGSEPKSGCNPHTVPLPQACVPVGTSPDIVIAGVPVPPIDRIKIFSDSQWEVFVLEWADSLRQVYLTVERSGGTGDMGRDVIAVPTEDPSAWDNYQCKHYDHPLSPTDIWIELGKLAYYTKRGDYTYPRKYTFVAPQGGGTKLSNLLKHTDELRTELYSNWGRYCRKKITSTGNVELDDDMKAHINSLDFSIFSAIPPLRLIDQHAQTRWYVSRFGGGLPSRPAMSDPPADIAAQEVAYVRALLDAYGEHLGCNLRSTSELSSAAHLQEHFQDSRLEFYSAESLRVFSRDTLPPGEFEKLQDEIHHGIKDDLRADHVDGYARVVATVKTSRQLQVTGHALRDRLAMRDRGGICHQLANDSKVRWVK